LHHSTYLRSVVALLFSSPPSHLFLCFLSVRPPPPPSTLFPYTTLFRSDGLHGLRPGLLQIKVFGQIPLNFCVNPAAVHRDYGGLDRKSTRLNSSHVSISYAVFCLKKKNTTDNDT